MSNNANNTNTINNVQNIKEDNAMNAMNTQNTQNTQNTTKEETTMKVITEANEIMKVFAEMCEANCRYAEDNERDEPYGTFTFGFNDREVHVCAETTLMVGLGDALEILTHVSEQRLIGTSIKLDELDRNGRDTVDVYNFIAWLYTRLYHGDTPITKLTFTGGQYTLQIEEEPERMKLALMQLCYRVADENGCRNVMQFTVGTLTSITAYRLMTDILYCMPTLILTRSSRLKTCSFRVAYLALQRKIWKSASTTSLVRLKKCLIGAASLKYTKSPQWQETDMPLMV